MFQRGLSIATVLAVCLASLLPAARAQTHEEGIEILRRTEAYHQFRMRPTSDLSRLIYLIDRFADSDAEILYNGINFRPVFAARIARWFLTRNYKEETPKEWIMKWCNKSVPSGDLIWIHYPDGTYKLGREILLEEIAMLEKAVTMDIEKKREASPASVMNSEEVSGSDSLVSPSPASPPSVTRF